jgi:hypothetical protein
MAKKQKKPVLSGGPQDHSNLDFSAITKTLTEPMRKINEVMKKMNKDNQKPIPVLIRKEDLILEKLNQMEQHGNIRNVIFVLEKHHIYLKKNPKIMMEIKSPQRYFLLKQLSKEKPVGVEALLGTKHSYASRAGLHTAISEFNKDLLHYLEDATGNTKMIVSPSNGLYMLNFPYSIEVQK